MDEETRGGSAGDAATTVPSGLSNGGLDALRGPALDPLFWPAARQGVMSAWYGHVPFAHWLVRATAPRLVVELGTHHGASYAAFCESVLRSGLPTRCVAVDTWHGDEQAGHDDDAVLRDLRAFHDPRYGAFSRLLRARFDEALRDFEDASIDLLHIDGLHSYEAVRHDVENWLPKLSERAVLLLHGTELREPGLGVHRFWEEISRRYPSFGFGHGRGLGVLAVGPQVPAAVSALCDAGDAMRLRERFAQLGAIAQATSAAPRAAPPTAASRPALQPATGARAAPRRLGIGVVTYNRPDRLMRCLEAVLRHTRHPYELVVTDDGSASDVREAMSSLSGRGIGLLRSPNMGVNWNKNRLLLHFNTIRRCDVTILLEDDTLPIADGWEETWIAASERWGHINNAGEWFTASFTGGDGSVETPYESANTSAQCAAFHRDALDYVGFIDPAMEKLCGGHVEHSYRLARAGFGGRIDAGGGAVYYLVKGHIVATREDSFSEARVKEGVRRFLELYRGSIHRNAWRNDAEQAQLWQEVRGLAPV